MLSNKHEGEGGDADQRPTEHRQLQYTRGGKRPAPRRRPHDAIRQNRRCNGCSRLVSIAGRQLRRVLGIVETQLESWRVIADICRKGEAAKCDQQTLRGDRIGNYDADQRSQEPFGLDAQSEYAAHANAHIDRAAAALHQLTTDQTLHKRYRRKIPFRRAINAWCGSKATLSRSQNSGPRHKRTRPGKGSQLSISTGVNRTK